MGAPGGLVRVSGPAYEPVTTDELKTHLRITGTAEDTYLAALITAAREHCETATGRVLIAQTFDYYIDAFPPPDEEIRLPRAPLISVTNVNYLNDAGVEQVASTSLYRVDAVTELPRITQEYAQVWPTTRAVQKAVRIRFVAGYEGAGSPTLDVPAAFKHAIKMLCGHWYENRETVNVGNIVTPLPLGVDAILMSYKLWNWSI